ncbi:Uu.00g041170.m01.CDS01 [Anthostomella pinea]|uniref:Uu.00g041170.m01.CDS01 n=1 Tax=Anthostomella pinea TaxID=933095 RepID=A0AAI8VA77_9PEZI|nr:Uu.00g041170.m01.CDS01 [Anthostomella pinea]
MASLANKVQEAAARNSELLRILLETDHAAPDLENQNAYIADLDKQLSSLEKRIATLGHERFKEHNDHEKYRDSVLKRFAYRVSGKTEKFAAKAEKEERDYFDALQKEHQAKAERDSLTQMRSEAQTARNDLEARLGRHTQAQQELDSLYDSLFQGPTPEFPEEDSSERNAADASRAYHDSRLRTEAETQVVSSLAQAQQRLNAAATATEEALDYSRMDMSGGGSLTDMMERNALSQAETQVSQMMSLVSQAQRMSPHVQALPPVRIAQDSLMSDVFFDNIFTDMDFHDKIKGSKDELQRCGGALRAQLANAQARHHACEQETSAKSQALKDARLELQRARERIFERISGGEVGTVPQGQTSADDPPPPYQ